MENNHFIILSSEQYVKLGQYRSSINDDLSLTTFVKEHFNGNLKHSSNKKYPNNGLYVNTTDAFNVVASFKTEKELNWFILHL